MQNQLIQAFTNIYLDKEQFKSLNLDSYRYTDALIKFIKDNNIKTVLDYGCGDWSQSNSIDWTSLVDSYIGADFLPAVVESNNINYKTNSIKFEIIDETFVLPKVDLIICKDVLHHLPNNIVKDLLTEFKLNSTFCILTNDIFYCSNVHQFDCKIGEWRTINLQSYPWYENGEVLLEWTVTHDQHEWTKQTFVIGSQPATTIIPKIILQTSRTPYAPYVEKMWQERTDNTWKRVWFNDAAAIKYFKNNPLPEFPNIIEVFNSFTYGPHKADLFRYYFMYINGGYFIDSDVMTYIRMDKLCPSDYDHLLVFAHLEWNNICNSKLNNEPIIFNGIMACVPKSKIMYDALTHAYNTTPDVLADFLLHLVNELYHITEKNKHNYNILFYEEMTEENAHLMSHTVDTSKNKIATHFYVAKTVPQDCRLYYWTNAKFKNCDFKFHIYDPKKDLGLSRIIYETECWEEKISEIIVDSLGTDGIFVDIGANIGWHTKLAQLHGNNVIAFEPQPDNYVLLKKNCNKLGSILYNIGLGDNTEKLKMDVDPVNYGNSFISETGIYEINVARLDDIISTEIAAKVKVVKMDVQGFETKVIQGGKRFFESLSKGTVILIEVNPQKPQFDMEVFNDLIKKASKSYAIFYFKDNYNTQMTINEAIRICYNPQEFTTAHPGATIPDDGLEFDAVITI